MNCVVCEGNAVTVKHQKQARYRSETVEVSREVFQCESCGEQFVTPQQLGAFARAVKNEVRQRYGLLSPERIVEIRTKLGLTQAQVEELLNTGPKVVVRWESGKVIQSSGQDNMLRLLEKDPSILDRLREVQQRRIQEQKEYEASHSRSHLVCA